MKKSTKDLTSGNLYRNFILFTIPLVLSSLLSQTFDLVDMVIAGRFIGDTALAATGATGGLRSLFSAPLWGFCTGFSIYVAHLFGAGRYRELKIAIYSVLLTLCCIVLGCSGVMILFREPLFRFLKVDAAVWDAAMRYYMIVVSGNVVLVSNVFGVFTLNAMGNTMFPFWMSVVSSIINLLGNIVAITVFHWGVEGLAVSTLLASVVALICYMLMIRRCLSQLLGGKTERFRFDFSSVRHAIRYAIPVSIQQLVMYLCTFGLSPIVNGMGMYATAGYAVAGRAYSVCQSFYLSSSKTVSNYVAQCCGSEKFGQIPKVMGVGFLQGAIFASMPLIPILLWPKQACGLFFTSGYEGAALEYAVLFCRVYLPFVYFSMINNQFHAFFRGFAAMRMLFASTALGTATRLVLSYLLTPSMGMEGIYLAWTISWAAEMVFSVFVYIFFYRNEKMLRKRWA